MDRGKSDTCVLTPILAAAPNREGSQTVEFSALDGTLTRRRFIAVAGTTIGSLSVAGMLAAPGASAASEPGASVLVARWSGVSEGEFQQAYLALGAISAQAEKAGKQGHLVLYDDASRDGLVLADWSSKQAAQDFAGSPSVADAARSAGAKAPAEVRVVTVSVS